MRYLFVIGIAFILDLIFGDPYWLLHPVCIIGKAISALEKMLRKIVKNELFAGTVLVLVISGLAFFVPFLILYLANTLNYYLAMGIEIYFCYQIFAVKSLKKESMKVYYPLKEGNYPEARKYLSYIVGRDTQNLDAKGITKATVETIAENTTDGVVAPLFIWQ
jgi:adenosylcobinamide-phosphate synthase